MNPFTERMSAIQYTGNTSIHPNGRDFHTRYPAAKDGKIRRKAMKRLNARRLAHSATVARKPEGYKMPGSMAR